MKEPGLPMKEPARERRGPASDCDAFDFAPLRLSLSMLRVSSSLLGDPSSESSSAWAELASSSGAAGKSKVVCRVVLW